MAELTAAEIGAKGGKARAEALTPAERSELARKAVEIRWERHGKKPLPRATHIGALNFGGEEGVECAVLEDGTRVLSQRGFAKAIGASKPSSMTRRGAGKLPAFLNANNLKQFIDEDLEATANPVVYVPKHGGTPAYGIKAEAIPKLCNVWLRARDAGVIRHNQQHIVQAADIIMRGLAQVGIIALVDEATGYQYDRPRRDLEEYLKKFLSENLVRWARTFPNDYFKHLCRLKRVDLRSDMRLPQYFGHLTNDLIYRRIAPGLLKALKNRRAERGVPSNKLYWWTSQDLGHPSLLLHLGTVVGLMKVNTDYDTFYAQLNSIAPIYPDVPGLFDNPADWQIVEMVDDPK